MMETSAAPDRAIGLAPAQLDQVFPFHLIVDRQLRVRQYGHSLERIFGNPRTGVALGELFELKRPELALRFDTLCAATDAVTLWLHRDSGMRFRGQLLPVAECDALLLLWSPWLSDNSELARHGLTLHDFALHDPVVDLLQVLQSHKIAFQDLEALTVRLHRQRSELKQAHEALKEQYALLAEAQEQLRIREAETRKLALIASLTDNAVVLTDAAGLVVWVNDGFTRITGYSLADIEGKRPGALLQGPKTDPATVAYIREQLRKREGFTAEIVNYRKNGEEYWLHIEVQPILDEGGQLTNFMAIERDITERKAYEQALLSAKREADAANQAKSEFLAAMSHEIRSPMTAVLGTLELLRSSPLNAEQQIWIRTAHESATALLKIIDDILDFSKIEAGKLVLHEVSFNLATLLEDIVRLYQPRANAKEIALSLTLDPTLPTASLRGDPFRLRQVLVNLIGNALKFTEHGRVTVTVTAGPREESGRILLKFRVDDTGIGIAADAQSTLFQEFVQLEDGSARRHGGTGLGLAICKRLVTLMGGEIGVDSTPGQGSSFWFTIRFKADAGNGHPAEWIADDQPPERQDSAPARILLAEDGEAIRMIITALLRKSGFAVHAVGDGKAAVEAVRTGDYDLVLMDGQMPEMDGSEAAQAIRALPGARGRIPIIALTANALLENREACLAAGMDDFITKPVDKTRLLETITHWLERGSSAVAVAPGTEPAAAPGIPWLDRETLNELAENTDEDTMRETVRVFFDDAAQRLDRMDQAAERGDVQSLRLEAHTLKGGGRLIGATRLGEVAARIEAACIAGDAAAARAAVPELRSSFERTLSCYTEERLL